MGKKEMQTGCLRTQKENGDVVIAGTKMVRDK